MLRFAAAVVAAVLVSTPAFAGPAALAFRDQAAEVSAASRLLSAYGIVTSTFRTVAHNKAVGGVPNSYHLLDRAIDVARRPGVTHREIDAALRKAGYTLVESLDELNHSHFAFAAVRPDLPASATKIDLPKTPAKPLARVAADEHGTLSIDLDAQARSTTAPDAKRQ